MRRNNLIFKGLPKGENQTWSETESLVSDFMKEKLGVTIGEIERTHHLGTNRRGSCVPVIVKFLNLKCKDEVLRNAVKLKNLESPSVSIMGDFSAKVRCARRKLWDYASQFRTQNVRYKMPFYELYVRNEVYAYDPVNEFAVLVEGGTRGGDHSIPV